MDRTNAALGSLSLHHHSPLTLQANGNTYVTTEIVGRGSFGVVYKAICKNDDSVVAIKKVLQDQRFKNRELQILKKLNHQNVVGLKDSFYCSEGENVYLHLVMEHVKETIHAATKAYSLSREQMPMVYVKLFIYQMARALGYIHSMHICHRDIKPQNLLVDEEKGILKLCDFGSAKALGPGESSVSYICSRYYRAPELIYKATRYTTAIDLWSLGCVLAEALLGEPLFVGKKNMGQLVEIVKVLGTPTEAQIFAMNKDDDGQVRFNSHRGPKPWSQVLGSRTSPAVEDLLSKLLCFDPAARISAMEICAHPFFDELRKEGATLPSGKPFPPLFNFTEQELMSSPSLKERLIPEHLRGVPA